MSDDIRAKAQAVLDLYPTHPLAREVAQHVLTTEARLDVALRGAMQSREEMREWLRSDETWRVLTSVVIAERAKDPQRLNEMSSAGTAGAVLAALVAAVPGNGLGPSKSDTYVQHEHRYRIDGNCSCGKGIDEWEPLDWLLGFVTALDDRVISHYWHVIDGQHRLCGCPLQSNDVNGETT